ncbi:MAG: hypothetical protein IPL26_22215 [Leptospiraceae bacterium]|nr:hypothetical protein [Leptospiraceae bacterium]
MNTNQGFDPLAFTKLYGWEKDNFWFVSRNDRIIYLAKEYLKEPFQFLEVGCGTGFVIEGLHRNFPKSTLKGSEFYAEGLEFAKLRNPNLEFLQMGDKNV